MTATARSFMLFSEIYPGSHWSNSYITALSLVETFRVLKYFHSDVLFCHKEPAQGMQGKNLLGALVLYGIRELA